MSIDHSTLPATSTIVDSLSHNTPILDGATWQSDWVDISGFSSLIVAVNTDQDGSYTIEFSPDGVAVDSAITRKFRTTREIPPERFTIGRQYVRISFTNNSGSNQTYFRFQTMVGLKPELNFPVDSVLPQHAGANAVRTDDFDVDVALRRREGVTPYRKFGYNPDIDGPEETVWSQGGLWTPIMTAETLDITCANANDTSGGTGARILRIVGVDANGLHQEEDITLNGGTVTTTTTWLYGLNRAVVISAGSSKANEGVITIQGTTSTTVQAHIPAGSGTMQQSFFICPGDAVSVVQAYRWNAIKVSGGGGSPTLTIKPFRHDFNNNTVVEADRVFVDTAVSSSDFITPPHGEVLLPGQALEFRAETDTANTAVEVNFWVKVFNNA